MTAERASAAEACAARLRQMIADGVLAAGVPLRQDELATLLGMSRTPVREAIAQLQAEGLAVIEPHRGATVFNPSPEALVEIYEVRLLLEPRAAAIAAKKADGDTVAALRQLYDGMEHSPPWRFFQLNREFHLRLYEAARHRELFDNIRSLRYRSDPYVRILVGGGGGPAAQQGHAALIKAVRRGDSDAAEHVTREHLQQTLDTVLAILQ
jgi:DNA-binding GntR family transcriptional regulator